MQIVENPYEKEYQELLKESDGKQTPEINAKLGQLKAKSEEFVRKALSTIDNRVSAIKEQKTQLETAITKSGVRLRQEYKKAIEIYREACDMAVAMRNLKKEMREMIDRNTKKRQRKVA